MCASPARKLTLRLLPFELAICRLEPGDDPPAWARRSPWLSMTRTPAELSVVCAAESVPADARCEAGWSALEVAGPLDFGEVGVLSELTGVLARHGIALFVLSTFDTDTILVKQRTLQAALAALTAAGHVVMADGPGS